MTQLGNIGIGEEKGLLSIVYLHCSFFKSKEKKNESRRKLQIMSKNISFVEHISANKNTSLTFCDLISTMFLVSTLYCMNVVNWGIWLKSSRRKNLEWNQTESPRTCGLCVQARLTISNECNLQFLLVCCINTKWNV